MDVRDPSAFEALLKTLKKSSSSASKSKTQKHDLLKQKPIPGITWRKLVKHLARPKDLGKGNHITALKHYILSCEDELDRPTHKGTAEKEEKQMERSRAAREWIIAFVTASISPIIGGCSPRKGRSSDDGCESDDDTENDEDEEAALSRCRTLSNTGHCFSILETLSQSQSHPTPLPPATLYTLISLTDPTLDMSESAVKSASEVISSSLAELPDTQAFITNDILQSYLRPLFSRARPAAITTTGRPTGYTSAIDDREAHGFGLEQESKAFKPWKFEDLRAIPVLRWAINEASSDTLSAHLTLFTPPLLTLLDDPTTSIREQGLVLLTAFLKKTPRSRLHTTGLSRVFEDAIMPTLMFLPSLTPEADSVQLLNAAYPALLQLAGDGVKAEGDKEIAVRRRKLLDRTLREGVFEAFAHSKEHIRIVEVLGRQTVDIVKALGLDSVKHLKDLIPMISTIVTDPFAMSHPAALAAMLAALNTIIENCWPRIGTPAWHGEITRIIVACALVVDEDGPPIWPPTQAAASTVLKELCRSPDLLAAAMRSCGGDVVAAWGPIAERDIHLRDLFGPSIRRAIRSAGDSKES